MEASKTGEIQNPEALSSADLFARRPGVVQMEINGKIFSLAGLKSRATPTNLPMLHARKRTSSDLLSLDGYTKVSEAKK
ncbi:hypothetical protein PGTUg99_000654 [Puccinia graminis f. sp. tritici]|nr:hypothetical protein PGTUg99_000654 [Puccinia graminis f. sp. tritici]